MNLQKIYILFWTLFVAIHCQYEIPSYYGFWSKRFYQPKVILAGQFTVFEMHFAVDLNNNGNIVYFADEIQHCIFSYDLTLKIYIMISGKCSKPGDRVGNAQSSFFNGPSSLVYYRPDPQRQINATNSKIYLTKNQTCSVSDPDCILNDVALQTLQSSLTLKNVRIYPFYNLSSINPSYTDEYLFISDRLNHCIKKITLKTQYTEVVAGICGSAGFLDGPLGFNKLNKPSNIGIDALGVVYFFDEGNEYMRKLNLQNNIETLLNGACTQYKRNDSVQQNRKVNNLELKKMICYSNWIQKKTASSIQHYFNEDLLNICTLHSSKCPSQQ